MQVKKNKQSGMTLIELLGAIIIMAIITTLIFPILIGGMKTAEDIRKETILRDEADYLMSAILKELYTTKESEITTKNFDKSLIGDYYIIKNNDSITGFMDNKLYVSNEILNTNNKSITLLPSSIKDLEEGQYEVILNLKLKSRNDKVMEFKNRIRTIYDINKEELD
ncbi:prepilin-type N-terminal cleavage/methylation domain-containing protein [Sporosarcina oncorhynchi]|uniref:Prepilin-type N-terminal cleavage/methylation domain-containing protein n=1 Tax=Sporosarcina oncorhynchi TaxID=3056444 RepID=A0ABZ0L836_9BACL|nr:prepilin-type N-terminal cleavage/methylation domain-containing protein [Sporosarcina sp. T2O-4]WOV88720.1 prepilin-type N-terminal cleavage/methylation domain-containing protein [Sporosarcina sp. T2O-4]